MTSTNLVFSIKDENHFLTFHSHINIDNGHTNVSQGYHESEMELFIHTDPCEQKPCAICSIGNCNFRKKDFVKEIVWTRENMMVNKKHSL